MIEIGEGLRSRAGGTQRVTLSAPTIEMALHELTAMFPDLRHGLYDESGGLRPTIRFRVGARTLRGEDLLLGPVRLRGGDTLEIADGPEDDQAHGSLATDLSEDEIRRYGRHLVMPEVGLEGQKRLKGSSVLCVGAGGLGSPLLLYLAAAGVGRLGIVEFDTVDLSNLQRQVLYGTSDIGRPKMEAARERLTSVNPEVVIEAHPARLTSQNAMDLIAAYDVVADGTDNFATRYLVNDACVLLRKPNVYASIFRFEGQVSVFDAVRGPCYRCLYPEPPPPGLVPSCAEGGVLGVLPGIIGSLQALEVLKLLLHRGDALVGRLVLFDALAFSFREFAVRRDDGCPVCGEAPTIARLIDYEEFCGTRPPHETLGEDIPSLSVEEYRDRRERREPLELIDVREPFEARIARIDGSRLIPLGDLASRLDELDRSATYVLQCHHGIRSAEAVRLMRRAGFMRLYNLAGGIEEWSRRVDPSVPRY